MSKRRRLDQYFTPRHAVEGLLDIDFGLKKGDTILEPCAGEGAISNEFKERGFKVYTNDYDIQFGTDYNVDACTLLNWDRLPVTDWVVTNPPFLNAKIIIQHSLGHARKGVVALLRLSFIEPCNNRVDFLELNPPSMMYVTPRISFTGNNKTDSVTTAWFIWLDRGVNSEFNIDPGKCINVIPKGRKRYGN